MHLSRAALSAVLTVGPLAALAADSVNASFSRTIPDTKAPPASHVAAETAAAGAVIADPGTPPRQLIVPDLAVVAPAGITDAQVAALGELPGVRSVLAADGGQVLVNGHWASVLGVIPEAFRPWTPPATATSPQVWAALNAGRMVTTAAAAARLALATGTAYPVTGTSRLIVPFGVTALLGVSGIDVIVNGDRSAQLGLVPDAAVLLSAPGASRPELIKRIRAAIGRSAQIATLGPAGALPAGTSAGPADYLQLFRQSAARYCPGLPWTVLAAIGTSQGPPDVHNPLGTVPAAARLLCADGATRGPAALAAAIYDYSQATWYVTEVLELASEYAREYN